MAKLKRGDTAPEFALPDQHGRTVKLADFCGGKLLVYFYPKADTPGCTRQACSIRDAREELRDLGLAVVGISPDQPARQQKFDAKYQLGLSPPGGPGPPGGGGLRRLGRQDCLRQKNPGDHPVVILDRCDGRDRGGLVRGQAGRHGPQGPKGPARRLSAGARVYFRLFLPNPRNGGAAKGAVAALEVDLADLVALAGDDQLVAVMAVGIFRLMPGQVADIDILQAPPSGPGPGPAPGCSPGWENDSAFCTGGKTGRNAGASGAPAHL